MLEHWRSHNYRAQVHPVALRMRRDLVYALGGWMALPAGGDTGLLLAANAISPRLLPRPCRLAVSEVAWPDDQPGQPRRSG